MNLFSEFNKLNNWLKFVIVIGIILLVHYIVSCNHPVCYEKGRSSCKTEKKGKSTYKYCTECSEPQGLFGCSITPNNSCTGDGCVVSS